MLKKIVSFVRDKLQGFDRRAGRPQTGQPETMDNPGVESANNSASTAGEARFGPELPPAARRYRRPRPPKSSVKAAWSLDKFEVPPVEGKSRFHDFDLPLTIMQAVADLGFQYCTPIQTQTLTGTMSGADAIGQAQTGTGKTAAFLISIMTRLSRETPGPEGETGRPRALVLAPTRELVMQIAKDGEALAKYSNIKLAAVFGGMDYEKQQRALERGSVDILVATPGRLLDFQHRRIVDLGRIQVLVIDEADRMLDMGFIPDVRKIVASTPAKEKRQTLMFSATITPEVRHLASQWCVNPIHVAIAPEQVAIDTVRQIVYLATTEEKYDILYNMIVGQNLAKVLVFANRRFETKRLADRLLANNISCGLLSGDVDQKKRLATLEHFRNGQFRVLVATDVAGRGIHIDGISHVFNYTLPYEAEDYVHRIGRTGRAGHEGVAISFADEEGAFFLPAIEEYIGRPLHCEQPDEALLVRAPRGARQPSESPAPSPARPGPRRSSSRPRSSARPGHRRSSPKP